MCSFCTQNESPAKQEQKVDDQINKQQEDLSNTTVIATEIVEDIIDDVVMSHTGQPSVPSVVFEAVTEFVSVSGDSVYVVNEDEDQKLSKFEYSENDISDIIDSDVEKVEVKGEGDFVSKSEQTEVQEVTVQVVEDKEEAKVITFGGKPVPETGVVIINGYAKTVSESLTVEKVPSIPTLPKLREDSLERASKQQSVIPQTDLDTFETRLTSENSFSQDLDVSNPDDDTSDRKSDTGSINTIDSVDKDEIETPNVQRRKKGNLRPRNVSFEFFLCLSASLLSFLFKKYFSRYILICPY